MRVSHVITRLIVGGAQENTVSTVLGLLRAGVETELISGISSGEEGTLEPQFAPHPGVLKIFPSLVRQISPRQDLAATAQLTRHFRETKPDIVHTHSGKAGIVGRLAAHRARVPIIIHTIHGPSFGPFQGSIPNFVYTAAEKFVAPYTTRFISVAQAMTDQYLAAGIATPDHYVTIYSGFPLEPFLAVRPDPAFRARLGIAPNDFVIAKLARLFELKGHDDLFDAAPQIVQKIPTAKFLLIGDGPFRQRLEQRAQQSGLKNHFIFAGLVPPREVPQYLSAADAVIHLSYREGLPRALSQALAAGLPVVAYDCDGSKEVCLDGQNGFLIAQKDLAALADRLTQLANDPALRARLAAAGRDHIRQNFSEQKMVDDILSLYKSLTK